MIDLKTILKSYPNCLSSRASFKSVLMDTYPDEKRTINILTILFECGVAQKIKSKPVLSEHDFQALLSQVENEYGIVSKYSTESIRIWADAFGISIDTVTTQGNAPKVHAPIVHAPIVEHTVVQGSKSDFETALESGSLTITKFIGFDESEIVVPNRIDGISVNAIGEEAFAKCAGIERVIISEGITEIRNGAFEGCTSLREIILPSSLEKIGNVPAKSTGTYSWMTPSYNGVFCGCAIENIQLPPTLRYIGGKAFQNCKNLKRINLPNKVQTIEESCFSGCSALKEALLPDNVIAIRASAFYNAGLEQIDIPPTCKEIARLAFKGCEHLSQISLHEGLIKIGDNAFENCKGLCTITIPNSVTEIGKQVFDITGWYQPYDRRRKGWSTREKSKDLVIACYAGSYGLDYARKEGYQIKNAAK